MMALGAIFTFSGANVGLGLGLMIGGATLLATTLTLDWNGVTDQVRTAIITINGIVGGALLAIGVMLLCLGSVPLGVGMIVAGAVGIASAIVLDVTGPTNQVSNTIKMVTAIVSGAALAIGVILVCLGIITPLSVGLIVAGAAGLVASVAVDWNWLIEKIQSILGNITEFFKNAWDVIKSIWNGAGDWFGGVWKSIISKFKPTLITDGFKSAWNALKSWKIPTPHLTWGSGGWEATGWIKDVLSALNLPTTMPKLNVGWYAKGGLFDSPNLVGVGEAGPEAVLPLNDSVYSEIGEGIIKALSTGTDSASIDKIISRMDSLQSAIENMQIVVKADNKKLAESVNAGNRIIGQRYSPIAST